MSLRVDDYDYYLPDELIASRPLAERDGSRMMVVRRGSGELEHRSFGELPDLLGAEDLLILNDTKVVPARVFSDDGKCELVVVEVMGECVWRCLVRPGKKFKLGGTVMVGGRTGQVTEIDVGGNRVIEFERSIDPKEVGSLALPHYMGRESDEMDESRYQTVYAKEEGSIAAPTAGLHFTDQILRQLNHDFLTLHVGVGTFRPVKADLITDHKMHSEKFELKQRVAEKINQAQRTIAVGTTVTRVLEAIARNHGVLRGGRGETDIFIHPPFDFRVIDGLLTNFHLPKSTLLMLVSALAGRELMLKAYAEAVREKYRFFSYGDCMLILD